VKKTNVIPAHLRMTTLYEYSGVESIILTKKEVSFDEARRRVRERVNSTEGIQVNEAKDSNFSNNVA